MSLPELCEAVSEKLNACKQRKQEAHALAKPAQQETLAVPTDSGKQTRKETPSPNQVDPDGRILLSLTRPTLSTSFQQPRAPPPSPGDELEEEIRAMENPTADVPIALMEGVQHPFIPQPPTAPQPTHYQAAQSPALLPTSSAPSQQQVTPVLSQQIQPAAVAHNPVTVPEAPLPYPPTITHQQPYPVTYLPPSLPLAQPYPSTMTPMMYSVTIPQPQQPIVIQPTTIQPAQPTVVQQQPSQPAQTQQTMVQ